MPDHATPRDDAWISKAASTLNLAGSPLRLKILATLAPCEMAVDTLVASVGSSRTTTFLHLGNLQRGRAIEAERRGNDVIYRLTAKGRALLDAVETLMSLPE